MKIQFKNISFCELVYLTPSVDFHLCGDEYSGYLLFPTHNKDEYFLLEYSC